MPIPETFKYRRVYHFTHIDNLPYILRHGLLSTNKKEKLNIKHTSIAYDEIQGRRACMDVPCGPRGVVHDYVPLYFCKRSSMLLAVVRGKIADQQLIIYFEFLIDIMNHYNWVFTDASANTSSPPNFYDNEANLSNLNWSCIDSLKWSMPSDIMKQKRQAELLIHNRIRTDVISRIIVWNEWVKKKVERHFQKAELTPPPIEYDNGEHFYTDFYASGKHSIVTGPYFIKKAYKETISDLLKEINKSSSPQFRRLSSLLEDGLRKDLRCLPETAELIGLKTSNQVHTVDVGKHTLQVVGELQQSYEFRNLLEEDKRLVEIAAYLHDIGKGPKSKWVNNDEIQDLDPDHPIEALPMLQRILTDEVERITPRAATVICKLVCYHDLIGDIIGKGRRIEELIDIVEDERDLDMLIALGKADMQAINPRWANEEKIEQIRTQAMAALT